MQRPPNYRPLSPLNFLERTAAVFPTREAVVYKDLRRTWAEFAARVYRLASALRKAGIGEGDSVAFLCPNIPQMLEAHYGIPLTGAMIVAINIRLAPKEVEYILNHSGAKAVFVDSEFSGTIDAIRANIPNVKTFVSIHDEPNGKPLADAIDYEAFLAGGSPDPVEIPIEDENHPLAINYTSGTTGMPKGVQFTHRSAYLNCLGQSLECGLNKDSKYLWVVPMFHCNGWCYTWAVTCVGATHVCMRKIDPVVMFDLFHKEKISMFCSAPTVLVSLYSHPEAKNVDMKGALKVYTGGAPPSPTVIKEMNKLGIDVEQIYGLTETYGPHTVCEWQSQWDSEGAEKQFQRKARQGVAMIHAHECDVMDDNMQPVARNGEQMGEVVMRGNNVMRGYYNDPEATAKAFHGGWFHSGDLGVMHPDGYIELRDRSKDIIISGGENISSIEVENIIYRHPEVMEVAVIGVPDEKWGEVPKAFVVPKPGKTPTAQSILEFCRNEMSHFKCPKHIEFGELPKTSTGKIKKFVLREKEWKGKEKRIMG